jgi:zinc transport system ATP-binding protein
LRLDTGEFVALVGPRGSGKTSLISAALGRCPIDDGSVELFGVAPGQFRHWERVGYVPEGFTFPTGDLALVDIVRTARLGDALLVGGSPTNDAEIAEACLSAVGLGDQGRTSIADLDEKLRHSVLVACGLAVACDLLIMDDPAGRLDVAERGPFVRMLRRRLEQGVTILISGRSAELYRSLANRVVVLEEGAIAYDGPPGPDHASAEHGWSSGGTPDRRRRTR